jgi:hypothetical protein
MITHTEEGWVVNDKIFETEEEAITYDNSLKEAAKPIIEYIDVRRRRKNDHGCC